MLANQAMVRHGDGRLQHKHGSEETLKSSSEASRRSRTPAERAKEKNDALFWAYVEAQAKTEAAWDRFDKLAAAAEPLDAAEQSPWGQSQSRPRGDRAGPVEHVLPIYPTPVL